MGGRLFWKFFLAIWLAQIVSFAGAGAVFWFLRNTESREEIGKQVRIDRLVGQVARTIETAGEPARAALERRWPRGAALQEVFVVDTAGRELYARVLPEDRLAVARAAFDDPRADESDAFRQPAPPAGAVGQQRGADRATGAPPGGAMPPDAAGPPRPDLVPPEGFGFGDRPPPGFHDARVVRGADGMRYAVLAAKAPARIGRPLPWAPIAAALAASIVFGAFLAWYFAAPIRVLRGAFDEAARGNLAQRTVPLIGTRRDELADLGRHFDRMAAQLAALMDGQRRLLHDVSHELRSPLARLQAAVGLARQQPEHNESAFDRIEREAERMNDLVGELLTLSRLEAGVQSAPPEPVDVAELTAAVVEDARFEAAADGREVEAEIDGPLHVIGQAELLHRAIENIVRNALRHTPEHSRVAVGVHRDGAQVRIAVQDAGPGVPAARLDEIFKPFVRMPGARSDGHGLGLAIARRVVESAGGSIQARNRPEGGLVVEIRLPVAAPPAAG